MTRDYKYFKKIDDGRPLASFFNSVMRRLQPMRVLCAPISFRKDADIGSFQDEKFADFCRYEYWMHSVVQRLKDWQRAIYDYFTEYDGNWLYYASTQRLAHNKEKEEGRRLSSVDVKTEGLPDNEYEPYSFLRDVFQEDMRDIVYDTLPSDLQKLCVDLKSVSQIDILKGLKKAFGRDFPTYKIGDNGEMRLVTWGEHELGKISRQIEAEDDSTRLLGVIGGIHFILRIFRSCKYNEDNKEQMEIVNEASRYLLDMDFSSLDALVKRYYKKDDENDLFK